MWRLLESPDDISLYLCENNCICLCAYEIGGVEGGGGGRGVGCKGTHGACGSSKISFGNSEHLKQTDMFPP